VLPHILQRRETAVLDTVSCPDGLPQMVPWELAAVPAPEPPDAARVAAAVGRYQALREFRSRLYRCLTARADALFELCDAILCADHAVTSLVQLSLVPEFRRGHGSLYDALAAGEIDADKLATLLTAVLPSLADGEEGRGWAAGHDRIDHGLLDRALAGVPAREAAQVKDACARWQRLRFAVDATAYPRPDAACSPERGHVYHGTCRCDGSSKTIPGWEYQFVAVLGHLRSAWAPLADVERTTPATRTRQTIGQVKNLLRRLRLAGGAGTPLVIFDAGYSAAALTWGLAGQPVHLLVRLSAGQVFYQDRVTWLGKTGRPGKHGLEVTCHDDRAQPNPEPDESLILPGTPRYGTVRADAWHGVHPRIHGSRGFFAGWRGELPVLAGTAVRVTVDRLPGGQQPQKVMWLWHAGPGPLSLDELWRAYLARFDIEHAFRFAKQELGLTAAKVRTPQQADRWVRLIMAAYAQLLLARPLAADLRRPWEKPPDPARPLAPARVRRGFTNIRPRLGTPAHVAKPARAGPGRPKGTTTGSAPRHPVPRKTAKTIEPDTIPKPEG
jgi:DDE superfamily endonuclease